MDQILGLERLLAWLEKARIWLFETFFVPTSLVQGVIILLALLLGWTSGHWLRHLVRGRYQDFLATETFAARLSRAFVRLMPVMATLLLLWVAIVGSRQAELPHQLLRLASSLAAAWVVIQLATSVVRERFWSRIIASFAWTAAALNILGLLTPTLDFLDTLGFQLGEVRLTALSLVKAGLILFVLLRFGFWGTALLERELRRISDLTPSAQVLLGKVAKIIVFAVIVMVSLSSIGIDFTALAVFSGAVGVGIGFGLQKVVGNLVSGIILLMDKSIKPGDVIEVGGVFGWITSMNARFVSVVTRDGTEHLIPNEDLITGRVVNWSYSDQKVRIKLEVGISYASDPRQAMKLMEDAGKESKRVLPNPSPVARLIGFGDSSVDLDLRFWIMDPSRGVTNVKSDILLKIWDKFKAAGIEIPFPQRDVNFRIQPESPPLGLTGPDVARDGEPSRGDPKKAGPLSSG